jgi:hypothetical protein
MRLAGAAAVGNLVLAPTTGAWVSSGEALPWFERTVAVKEKVS